MKMVLLAVISLFSGVVYGQVNLAVSSIADEVKTDANAVVRSLTQQITVIDEGSASERITSTVTVLNSKAKSYGNLYIFYDKFSKVTSFGGAIYDRQGVLVKKLKKSDFKEMSANSGGTMYGDNRVIVFESPYVNYPLTFHYEYEVEYSGLLFIAPFNPVPGYSVGVEHARYEIRSPNTVGLRYKGFNGDFTMTDYGDQFFEHLSWEVKSLRPILQEPFSPPSSAIFPYVLVGVNNFKMGSYSGDLRSWVHFGLWINLLNKGRNDLSEALVESVKEMTKGLTPIEKVRKLYEYVQSKTRYVSIQLGIGGWQPYPASMVEKTGYGDCKALVNYMQSLLAAVDIPAYYTLVKAGPRAMDINTAFPSSQFNHVILSVPMGKDTIWLECTSQTQPFGFLGSFTADRHALLISEHGGTLVKTPRYPAEVNTQSTTVTVKLEDGGQGELNILRYSKGIQTENNGLEKVINYHENEQRKWLMEFLGISSFNLLSYKILQDETDVVPVIKQEIDLQAKNIYSVSGSRIFVKPNILNVFDIGSFNPLAERKLPVHLKSEFLDVDTTAIEIPVGYKPEFVPANRQIDTIFGTYQTSFEERGTQLIYNRMLKLKKGEYEPSLYMQLLDFLKEVKKNDEVKVVLVRRE